MINRNHCLTTLSFVLLLPPFLGLWPERPLACSSCSLSAQEVPSALADMARLHPHFLSPFLNCHASYLCLLPSLPWENPGSHCLCMPLLQAGSCCWQALCYGQDGLAHSAPQESFEPGQWDANSFRESRHAQRRIKNLGQNTVLLSPRDVVLENARLCARLWGNISWNGSWE